MGGIGNDGPPNRNDCIGVLTGTRPPDQYQTCDLTRKMAEMATTQAAPTLEELLFTGSDDEACSEMKSAGLGAFCGAWERREEENNVRKKKKRHGDELKRLRAAANELETRLLQRAYSVETTGDWWDAIAARQRAERGQAVEANALLRDALKRQTRVAKRTADTVREKMARLTKMYAAAGLARSTTVRPPLSVAPRFSSMAWMLQKRVDSLHEKLLAEAKEQHDVFEKRVVEPYEHGGARLEISSGRFLPFKLSMVAAQLWETIVVDSLQEQCYLFDAVDASSDAIQSAMWSHVELESGVMEVHGGLVMRRVYEADGSVLLLFAAILMPCGATSSVIPERRNLVDGLRLEEYSWCRIRRHAEVDTSRTLVHYEGFSSQEMKPLHHDDKRSHLGVLREFLRLVDEDIPRNRQRLENRLLDAALAIDQCKLRRVTGTTLT